MGDINENKDTQLQARENEDDFKWKLWRKFRPRLWFSSMWKKYSMESRLNGVKTFLQVHIVPASISVALGMCYLLMKSRGSKCKVAPYSDLLKGIQDGSVMRVQFKENSRLILYNSKPQSIGNAETSLTKSLMRKNKSAKEKTNGGVFRIQEMVTALLRSKKQHFVPVLNHSMSSVDEGKNGLLANQDPKDGWQYSTRYVDDDYMGLLALMKEKGTTFGLDPEPIFISTGRRIFSTLLNQAPSWAMLFLIARGLGGGSSIARKPNKNDMITFDDVEGVDAAKTELMEIVSCLQGDPNYKTLGAKLPRGVLLVGPPGTGKTLLARAVAEKAGVPFFITCASEFVELFVGRGASRIRDLFKEARKCEPSIIFIDELDAVGLKRGKGFNTEGDQTLNQLLTEMDGFESDKKVVVIAATNRPEMLDPALLRAGRFSRKVFVKEPDEAGRRKILAVHFRGVPLEEDRDVVYNYVASQTEGLVGADLANIVNESALLAARRGGNCVSRQDIVEAIERAKSEFIDRQQRLELTELEAHEISKLLTRPRFDF